MKNLLRLSVFAGMLLSLSSCSVESIETIENEQLTNQEQNQNNYTCSNADPQARLINNGTVPLTFKVYSNNFSNSTIISNVQPGASSGWVTFVPGEASFLVNSSTSGVSDSKAELTMTTCSQVDIVIDINNLLLDPQPIDL